MSKRTVWSRVVCAVGAAAMLVGLIDPLDLSLVILVGSALIALGVVLARSGRTLITLASVALALIAVGVVGMFVLTALGGVGGTSGRSGWWALVAAPYLVGLAVAFAGAVVWVVGIVRDRRRG